MDKYSYIANADPAYLESLYQTYKSDPESIDIEWRKFFEGFDFAQASFSENGHTAHSAADFRIFSLIQAYREKGHLISKTNPLRERKDRHAHLSYKEFGFSEADLDTVFDAGDFLHMGKVPLRAIIAELEKTYCGDIGFEYDYVIEPEEKKWLHERIEKKERFDFSSEEKRRILKKLNETVVFEQFLDKKYVGQKRFSIEGAETTIPALDAIINTAADLGVEEFAFAMAHRGRLNVLANIFGKTYGQIFNEFEGHVIPDTTMGDGDVKYHLGYSSQVDTASGKKVHLKLIPNPSHLEAVDAVVEGFVRAKADILYNGEWKKILPITIHGDAAVAGQGVVYEILQMSGLKGYQTGGTFHFVINNQIGFTTDFDDARSSNYCTSVAATVNAPVIHVNGDDVEAVVFAVQLGVAYRQKFNKDFFVDMVCYRKHGHNEGDDPKYTQPHLYKLIGHHHNPREIYVKKLEQSHEIDQQLAKEMEKEFWNELQQRLDAVKQNPLAYEYQEPEQAWRKLKKTIDATDFSASPETAVADETIDILFKSITHIPEGFKPLKKIEKLFESQKELFASGKLDWAMGELLAYGSLLAENKNVRMSGQDVKRGTFSHRHAVIWDEETNAEYNRLKHLPEPHGKFHIYNSLLSEFGVLGFEFGYSLASPDQLVLWEAQFGDFSNGAQTIIDQFIASSVSKWQRMSGLVLLLPHGYEGQGPEHSSARLERFLQMCAEFNLIVVNLTTPANFFHALRRQLAWEFRRPLIIMSPKSLLRHPLAQSDRKELSAGKFREYIPDNYADAAQVKKIILCSGKVYYDLFEYQQKEQRKDVAVIRIEQLYPFSMEQFEPELKKYPAVQLTWVQEEPANMGAWQYIRNLFSGKEISVISRKASASTATGFLKIHQKEQKEIVGHAFKI